MNFDTYSSRKEKILITVKTYPTLSKTYDELVCTAGITESGQFIRLYPIPFRKLDFDNQYAKYEWIELLIEKNRNDPRPESFRPVDPDNIKKLGRIDTKNKWKERKNFVLKNVYNDISVLIDENKNDTGTSLAIFKPTKIKKFTCEQVSRDWDPETLAKILEKNKRLDLFSENKGFENPFQVVNKLPYKFSYTFEDIQGKERTLMIEDWELGQLYWNCLISYGDEETACNKIKQKYFDEFMNKDLHFFLGTTRRYDKWAHNPFIIIGAFYPPKDPRISLF